MKSGFLKFEETPASSARFSRKCRARKTASRDLAVRQRGIRAKHLVFSEKYLVSFRRSVM
jgi:hypothetical protein